MFQFQFICVFSPFRMCTQHFSTASTGWEKDRERGWESRSEREREGEAAACRRCIELSLNYAAVQSYGLSFFGFNSVCFVCVLKRSAAISKLPQNEAQIDRQTDWQTGRLTKCLTAWLKPLNLWWDFQQLVYTSACCLLLLLISLTFPVHLEEVKQCSFKPNKSNSRKSWKQINSRILINSQRLLGTGNIRNSCKSFASMASLKEF